MFLRFTTVLFVFSAIIVSISGREIGRCNDCRFWPRLDIFGNHEKSPGLAPSEIVRQETPIINFRKDLVPNLKAPARPTLFQNKIKKLKRSAVGDSPETTISDSVVAASNEGSHPTTTPSISLILNNATTAATISTIPENVTAAISMSTITENATTPATITTNSGGVTSAIPIDTIPNNATTEASMISGTPTTTKSVTDSSSSTVTIATATTTASKDIISESLTNATTISMTLENGTTAVFMSTISENATTTKIITGPSSSTFTSAKYPPSPNTTPTAPTNPTASTTATPNIFPSAVTSSTTILLPSSYISTTIQSSSAAFKNNTQPPDLFPTGISSSTDYPTFPSSLLSTTTLQPSLNSTITATSAQPTIQTNAMEYTYETPFATTIDEADTTSQYDEYDYIDTLLTDLLINNQDFKILEKSMEELSDILSCLIKKLLQEGTTEMNTCLTMSDLDVSTQDIFLRLERLMAIASQSGLLQSIIDYLHNTSQH